MTTVLQLAGVKEVMWMEMSVVVSLTSMSKAVLKMWRIGCGEMVRESLGLR